MSFKPNYQLVLRVKDTRELALYKGYVLESQGKLVAVEVLDENLTPTGGCYTISPSQVEILDPQPYLD